MSDEKIINTLQLRRQLKKQIEALADTENEAELIKAVRAIAHSYPADQVLQVLVRGLDTPSSQIRGGLGHLAALLPPDDVLPALRQVVAGRQNSPQMRVTAAMIIERYLGQTLPAALIGDLSDTNEVAFQSLREAVSEGKRNRAILLDYVTQMRQNDVAIAMMVLELIDRLAPADRVELLRLIAQDDRSEVAQRSLQRLEALGTGSVAPDALEALYTLQFALPPKLADAAERSVRKLRLAGNRYEPPTAWGWRALISPAEMNGNQTVWLVRMPAKPDAVGALLGFVLNLSTGILQMFASETMPLEHLPSTQEIGNLISVDVGQEQRAVLLEAPFDYGRWLLTAALAKHWERDDADAIPAEFKLYNNLVNRFSTPQVEPDLLQAFYALKDPLPPPETLESYATGLAAHPAMRTWTLQRRAFGRLITPADESPGPDADPLLVHKTLESMAQWPESERLRTAMAGGLRSQSAWFRIAGEVDYAQRAAVLAQATLDLPFAENPLLAQLVAAALRRS